VRTDLECKLAKYDLEKSDLLDMIDHPWKYKVELLNHGTLVSKTVFKNLQLAELECEILRDNIHKNNLSGHYVKISELKIGESIY
jgi:hypothetical protein